MLNYWKMIMDIVLYYLNLLNRDLNLRKKTLNVSSRVQNYEFIPKYLNYFYMICHSLLSVPTMPSYCYMEKNT